MSTKVPVLTSNIAKKDSSRLSEFQETAKNGSKVMDCNIFGP